MQFVPQFLKPGATPDQSSRAFLGNVTTALNAGSALTQGLADRNAGDFNAGMRTAEGAAAAAQSLQAENVQRRNNREFLGRQATAMAQAGTGPGGTNEGVQAQSATNAELDALTTRYKGAFTQYGYDTEAMLAKRAGATGANNGYLRAGAALLRGAATNYLDGTIPAPQGN